MSITDIDTKSYWMRMTIQRNPQVTKIQLLNGDRMMTHPDTLPIIILVAIYICCIYQYGHKPGEVLLIILTQIPQVLISYGTTRTATFSDRIILTRRFVHRLIKGDSLPFKCFQDVLITINKKTNNESFQTNNKKSSKKVTKKSKNAKGRYCQGASCNFDGCTNKTKK